MNAFSWAEAGHGNQDSHQTAVCKPLVFHRGKDGGSQSCIKQPSL